jgi:hypothetical protein
VDEELSLGASGGQNVRSEGIELYRLDGPRVLLDLLNFGVTAKVSLLLMRPRIGLLTSRRSAASPHPIAPMRRCRARQQLFPAGAARWADSKQCR